jgi:hypothetical protein
MEQMEKIHHVKNPNPYYKNIRLKPQTYELVQNLCPKKLTYDKLIYKMAKVYGKLQGENEDKN